ncbi:hypothetical protein EV401DRAFT_1901140 [Pisolithus croceorrhizus]|nr:hypothetical protein EV401DRAFT_1901140 [Pisolithus croceorrhizus]
MTIEPQVTREPQTSKAFHVAIVGGGLCGLLCAVYLARSGIKVDVFESASKFREVGAGIWLGTNALRALDEMGLKDAIVSHADGAVPALSPFTFVSAKKGHQLIHSYQLRAEDETLGIHRAACLEALAELLDPAAIHFNKRCTYISQGNSSQPVIHFKDGTSFETDVVIGADGIKSAVRQAISGETARLGAKFTKTVAYRALFQFDDIRRVSMQTDLSCDPHCFVGMDKHIITIPIRGSKILNVVIFYTDHSLPDSMEIPPNEWVTPASRNEVLAKFSDCGPDVQKLLSLIETCNKWCIHAVDPPLGSFVKGRVALAGDSAHGMCPHLGSGFGQGIEDALILCRLLTHSAIDLFNVQVSVMSMPSDYLNGIHAQKALLVYDRICRPRANMVLTRSAWAGEVYESLPHKADDNAKFEALRNSLAVLWEPVWRHDLQKHLATAMDMLGTLDNAGSATLFT